MTTASAPHPYLDRPGPLAFAHRGGAAGGAENTLAAFRRAVDLGYHYLETDVHVTSDGVLVAFHDETLDRVTDSRGRIGALPWSEVRKARVAGREPIATFAGLLDAFPLARWNVDAKSDSAVAPLIGAIRAADAWDRVCVGSFSEARVARAHTLAGPRLATSLGTRGVLALRLGLGAVVRAGALCVQVPERAYGVRVVDRGFIAAAHRRGLQVHVWTVNRKERMTSLLDMGVDGIMTDHIEDLRAVLSARGAWG